MKEIGKFYGKSLGQKAQGMVEYALVIAFVVAIAAYFISSTNPIGEAVNNTMDSAATQLNASQN